MKKLFTILVLTLLFAGTASAQSDSDAHTLQLTNEPFALIQIRPDLTFTYNVPTQTISGSQGTTTSTQSNTGYVEVTNVAGSQLGWATNLSNMKITVERSAYSGFDLLDLVSEPGSITGSVYNVGTVGTPVGPVSLTESTQNFITGISQAGGISFLTYQLDFSIFDLGVTSTEVTYTIIAE